MIVSNLTPSPIFYTLTIYYITAIFFYYVKHLETCDWFQSEQHALLMQGAI